MTAAAKTMFCCRFSGTEPTSFNTVPPESAPGCDSYELEPRLLRPAADETGVGRRTVLASFRGIPKRSRHGHEGYAPLAHAVSGFAR